MTRHPHVLVVGDIMLDRYIHGEVTRISPEAPVPVVKVSRQEDRLGGAANVAANIAALGARATLAGVVGTDEAGWRLQAMASEAGITGVIQMDSRMTTTVKTRVIGGHQQMLRLDTDGAPDPAALDLLMQDIKGINPDVIVLSDYAKGTLASAQTIIQRAKCPVLVDPKGTDWERYRGATLIKPNLAEIQAMGVWPVAEKAVSDLRRGLEIGAVLVTCGDAGMSLFYWGGVIDQPAKAKSVFDVTGAGDTVIAAMAVANCWAAGDASQNWVDALRFASAAAGIAVGKLGTSTATANEVEAVLNG